ncbi:hypothetical protein D6855_15305 [Butyrivibrio sp. CB08]|uniref:hypothetical protein n=1 Tax=Butyrivibrio sp. CB08 TaxID=2364879 RepID=UPI000EAA2697|nr:hypothetical protein [Butyrivibrio sp. CB08]RKM55996.1 hypothetical protein D6855_15305 [Butyrivibrio sp. CB08]
MKNRKLISALLALTLSTLTITACGQSDSESTSVFENVSDSESTQTTNTTSNSDSADASTESPASESTPATGDLYESFKSGDAKAKYTGNGDRTSYLCTYEVLDAGQSYTLSEISDKLATYDTFEFKPNGDATYRNIDCGNDGTPELLVSQEYTAGEMGGEVFTLFMILKDMGGELKICFDQDMWSRSDLTINDDGTIYGDGSGGAALHIYDYAYVDAAGDYHFYYGCEENITPFGDFYYFQDGQSKSMSLEGLDTDHLIIVAYYFEPDYEKRSDFVSFNIIDDNYNLVTTESDFDASSPVVKRISESGIKFYQPLELAVMLRDRATEIGYPVNAD